MAKPRQQEPEPLSEKLFERAVKRLLDTPPQPHGGKKVPAGRKAKPKTPKKPTKG